MSVVVVTVTTTPAAPTTVDSSSSSSGPTLSSWTIAGIIIGSLLGGVLLIGLAFYLLNRRRKHQFTRVANPTHVPSTSSRKKKAFPSHSQRASVSTEPLMSPFPWPQRAYTSQIHSQNVTPLRSDSHTPGIRDSQYSLYETDLAEISQVIAAGTITHSASPAILNIPPARKPQPASPQPSRSDANIGDATDGTSPKPRQSQFLHRVLQSRAQASEALALSPSSSLAYPQSRSATMDSSGMLVGVDALLADAERSALRDAEASQRDVNQGERNEGDGEGEDGEDDDLETTESEYSQVSAPLDHSAYFSESHSRQNSVNSVLRKNSTRRRGRMPALPPELPPVVEVPDTPRTSNIASSRPVSTAANSSLHAHGGSHGTRSRRSSLTADQRVSLPLLTSFEFGKDSSTSAGSVSSNAGRGSNSSSSGRASRYPSIALSSAGQSSGSGSRSEGEMDWHHPPSGLAALTSLQIGTLHNPHSPVEQPPPSQTGVSRSPSHAINAPPAPDKRARLREGRVGSIPEVERRSVLQGGIASIDVSL